MANFSTYLEAAVLNEVLRGTDFVAPATVYLGIASDVATAAELEAGTLTNEITGYTGDRPAISMTAPADVADGSDVENTAQIEYEDMPAVTVAYTFIADAAVGGNILTWHPIVDGAGNPTTAVVEAGGILRIAAGDVRFNLD